MSAAKKDRKTFGIRLERPVIQILADEAAKRQIPTANEFAADLLREKIAEFSSKSSETTPPAQTNITEIDLRAMLIEAHRSGTEANRVISESYRTIAELSATVTALNQQLADERKKSETGAPAASRSASTENISIPGEQSEFEGIRRKIKPPREVQRRAMRSPDPGDIGIVAEKPPLY